MRARWIAALVAGAGLLGLPAAAVAGGWATVSLSSTPDGLGPGQPWVVEMEILQHGRTPLDGVEPSIVLTNGATGKTEYVAAKPTGRPGIYEARAVFPEAGRWTYAVDDGFSRVHDYPAVTIGGGAASAPAAAGADDGFPWSALLVSLLAGLAAAALTARCGGAATARRWAGRPEPWPRRWWPACRRGRGVPAALGRRRRRRPRARRPTRPARRLRAHGLRRLPHAGRRERRGEIGPTSTRACRRHGGDPAGEDPRSAATEFARCHRLRRADERRRARRARRFLLEARGA